MKGKRWDVKICQCLTCRIFWGIGKRPNDVKIFRRLINTYGQKRKRKLHPHVERFLKDVAPRDYIRNHKLPG